MSTSVSITDLKRHLKSLLDQVALSKQSLILTRDSQPEAALIPYEDYLRLQRLEEQEAFEAFDGVLKKMAEVNAHFSDEEIEADLEAIDRENLEKNAARRR